MIIIVLNEFQFSGGQNSGAIFVMRNSKLSFHWTWTYETWKDQGVKEMKSF